MNVVQYDIPRPPKQSEVCPEACADETDPCDLGNIVFEGNHIARARRRYPSFCDCSWNGMTDEFVISREEDDWLIECAFGIGDGFGRAAGDIAGQHDDVMLRHI
ncbi:hypothetical protein ABRA89_12530 [Fulvimarina sp. MAC8]